jgi:pimeloyl-ACP methyl ester carboxylesterase
MAERAGAAVNGGRTLVLVHGAWQGAWSFDAWLPHLAAHGWQAHAVNLPGNGWPPQAHASASLASYTAHVAALLRGLDGPVVLVGHSGGGITATQVAEALPERVAAVVYLAGMMLPSGTSYGQLLRLCQAEAPEADLEGIAPYLQVSADGQQTSVPPEAALQVFLHDCAPAAAQRAAALLRPQQQSGRLISPRWCAQRAGTVPRVYVECTDDRSVKLAVQRKMQQLTPGATRISLDCGHVPQLAQPALLTERLASVLDTVLASALPNPP